MLSSKIVDVKERFEYFPLDQGLILENLRKNHFLVDDTCVKLQDLVLVMMEKNMGEEGNSNQDELMCQIDYMPVEKHHSKNLGCGHTVCNECWVDYIE